MAATRSNRTEFPVDAETQQLFVEEVRGAFVEEPGLSEVFEIVGAPQ